MLRKTTHCELPLLYRFSEDNAKHLEAKWPIYISVFYGDSQVTQ